MVIDMKEKIFTKERIKNIGIGFLICFLFTFMLMIFGPAEIYFVNVAEFKFVYGEFVWILSGIALVGAVLAGFISAFLPAAARKILWSVLFGLSIAGYAQVMFINEGLDLLGMNPEGYQVENGQAAVNGIIWLVIVALVTAFSFWRSEERRVGKECL